MNIRISRHLGVTVEQLLGVVHQLDNGKLVYESELE